MTVSNRRRIAFAVLMALIVFLLGSLYHEVRVKDRDIAHLATVQRTITDKLAEILAHTLQAEQAALEAGQTPTVSLEDVLAQVKGVDQSIIDDALAKAYRAVASTPGAAGATGARGPAGPAGPPGAAAAPSTPAAPAGTTTTTRPAPSTTSSSTSTTARPTPTTRPCTLGLLGACLAK